MAQSRSASYTSPSMPFVRRCTGATVVAVGALLLFGAPRADAGGVFITGHDPDVHAHIGQNAIGARNIIRRAIEYVTFNEVNPTLLLVTDLRNPEGDQSDSRFGMSDAGYSYDVADYGSGAAGVLDLHTVNFSNYDAVVVASGYGGWLRQDELDILNARSADLIDYVNTGNRGIVAFSEVGSRVFGNYPGPSHDFYKFLPFVVATAGFNQAEQDITLTQLGQDMGLTQGDINGNFSHSVFTETGGMDVIDIDSLGQILTLATREHITVCGVCDPAICAQPECAADCAVRCNQPPEARCVDVTVGADATCSANASIDDGSFDLEGDAFTCTQAPAGPYGLGTRTVTLTCADDQGRSSFCTGTVTVADSTPPIVTTSGATKPLWPPNHRMVAIDVAAACGVTITDNCAGSLFLASAGMILSAASDEQEDATGLGDGLTCEDVVLSRSAAFLAVRAERLGAGNGRVYTIQFNVRDPTGNATAASCRVQVQHDRSPRSAQAVDDGCAFCVGPVCGSCPGPSASCGH